MLSRGLRLIHVRNLLADLLELQLPPAAGGAPVGFNLGVRNRPVGLVIGATLRWFCDESSDSRCHAPSWST